MFQKDIVFDSLVSAFLVLFSLLLIITYVCKNSISKKNVTLYFQNFFAVSFVFFFFYWISMFFNSSIKVWQLSIGLQNPIIIEYFLFSFKFDIMSFTLFIQVILWGWTLNNLIGTYIPDNATNSTFIFTVNLFILSMVIFVLANTTYTIILGYVLALLCITQSYTQFNSKYLNSNHNTIYWFYNSLRFMIHSMLLIIVIHYSYANGVPLWIYLNHPFILFRDSNCVVLDAFIFI